MAGRKSGMDKSKHCSPNARSRDVPKAQREELARQALEMKGLAPRLLEEAGLDLQGSARVCLPKEGKARGPGAGGGRLEISAVTTQSQTEEYESRGLGPCAVFIAASHTKPGGGWLSGARAQEESVSRQSTWAVQCEANPVWHKSSESWLGPAGALVIDGVHMFGDKPSKCVFAGVACANKSACGSEKLWAKSKGERVARLAGAVAAALDEAAKRGCKSAVLAGFGTGVFGWDKQDCMEALGLALDTSRFEGAVCLAAGTPENEREFRALVSCSKDDPGPSAAKGKRKP